MDPLTLALGVGLVAGAVVIDTRAPSFIQQVIFQRLNEKALIDETKFDQPTEDYFLKFDEIDEISAGKNKSDTSIKDGFTIFEK